jgi:hypothetical protein
MKRLLGPVLLVLLLVGVGAAIYFSASEQLALQRVTVVRGLIGSEKEEFFHDPRVVEALRKGGLEVQVEKAGSRTIAIRDDLTTYDFAFPAGIPAAEKMRQAHSSAKLHDVFYTPMAIATWKPIAQILESNGAATDQIGYYTLDIETYLQFVIDDRRWKDLNNSAAYPVNKNILITSTDVRKSNSGAMYLALASYAANGNQVVVNDAQMRTILPLMESLFLKQGYTEYSSEAPFEDYLIMGVGKAPMVMIYEGQFIYQSTQPNGITDDMVLMYPEPTIFSKHILVSFSDGGARLGELLLHDPELQKLAIEHGFRNTDTAYFKQFVQEHSLGLPDILVNIIEPPSYEVLERMIQKIEQQYQ